MRKTGAKFFDQQVVYVTSAVLSALLGLGLSVATRVAEGQPPLSSDPADVSRDLLVSLLTGALGPAIVFIHKMHKDDFNSLTVRWSRPRALEAASLRLKIAHSLQGLVDRISHEDNRREGEVIAHEVAYWMLVEQLENVKQGKIQLLRRGPSRADGQVDYDKAPKDPYEVISSRAVGLNGCSILATAFTNSRLWWLRESIAEAFFRFNLKMLANGVPVTRIFGVDNVEWRNLRLAEDETGAKADLLQLHADLQGATTRTVEYSKLSSKGPMRPDDCLLLLQNGVPLIGLEWEVDALGAAERVYVVFSETRLGQLHKNIEAILSRGPQDGVREIKAANEIDPKTQSEVAIERMRAILRKAPPQLGPDIAL